jgi:hypothetical protein
MDVYEYENQLKELDPAQQDYTLEILRIQRKFLYSMCHHNHLWAKITDNPEIASIHLEAADSILKTVAQYDEFLEKYYQNNTDVGV